MNYYYRFIDNLLSVVGLLYEFFNKGIKWEWSFKRERVFKEIKELICFDRVLCYYDVKLFLKLVVDVLFYGIGFVFFYMFFDGLERFIVFVLCILN